jgi:GTP-binding protein Era
MCEELTTRFATVVLAGEPNVGKSTLLNALVGEKLAIVSSKPQSTRAPVMGLVTDRDCQLLFVDPPGLLEPRSLIHESMMEGAAQSLRGADAVLVLRPLSEKRAPDIDALMPTLRDSHCPVATVFTKSDAFEDLPVPTTTDPCFVVSARTGDGIPTLLEWCRQQAPVGEFRYDPEDIGTQPLRFFVAELVRESAFDHLEQELPYAMAALVDEFRENQDPVYIRVILYVERESQKGVVIGRDGSTIKAIGADARSKVEELLGQRVYLDLWVKVLSKWRKSPRMLRMFGLPAPSGKGKRAK